MTNAMTVTQPCPRDDKLFQELIHKRGPKRQYYQSHVFTPILQKGGGLCDVMSRYTKYKVKSSQIRKVNGAKTTTPILET